MGNIYFLHDIHLNVFEDIISRGHDSVIRGMNILVCSGIDSLCAYSTFALKLEDK